MRLGFQKLIAIPLAGLSEHEDLEDLNGSGSERATDGESKEREVDARPNAASTAAHADGLRHELKRRHKEAQNYMLTVTHNRVLRDIALYHHAHQAPKYPTERIQRKVKDGSFSLSPFSFPVSFPSYSLR